MTITLNNKFFIVILGLIFVALLNSLKPILTPFLVGALLAYLADPLVERISRWGVPRLLSVIIIFLILITIFTLIILLIIPLIQKQIISLIEFIPKVISWLQNTIMPWLINRFGIQEGINIDSLKQTLAENWSKAGSAAGWIATTVLQSGMALVELVTNLLLIPVVTFYLLRDWSSVIGGIRNLLPRKIEPMVVELAKECNSVLSAFFRGQLMVMLALGIIYSIGLTAIGLQIGLMIGLIAGAASIVPYLGFIVGITSASIAAYVQFGTLTSVILVFIVFAIGQILESTLLTPNLVGDRIGLHPVAVIFAILAGGHLFGFFGVLLALPVAAVIMVLLRFVHHRYQSSQLYKTKT